MKSKTSLQKFTMNIWSLMFSQIFYRIVSLVLAVYMARYLGASDLGIYYTVMSVIAIFTAFIDLGMTNFIIKEVSQNRTLTNEYFNIYFTLQSLIGFLFIGFIICTGIILGYSGMMMNALIVGSISPLLSGLANCYNALLSAQELLYPFAIIEIVCLLFYAAANVSVIVMGYGILSLIVVTVLTATLKFVLAVWWGVRFNLHIHLGFDRVIIYRLLILGMPFLFINGIHLALQRLDVIYLSIFKSHEQIGHYAAASRLIFSMIFFITILAAILYPIMARLFQENRKRASNITTIATTFILCIGFAISLVSTLAGERIILFLYGSAFSDSVHPFIILTWFIPVFGFGSMYGNILLVGGRVWNVVIIHILTLLIFTLGTFLIIPSLGITGIAYSIVGSEIIRTVLYIIAVRMNFHIPISFISFAKLSFISLVCFYIGSLIIPVSIVSAIVISLITFVAGSLGTGVIKKDHLILLRQILFSRINESIHVSIL